MSVILRIASGFALMIVALAVFPVLDTLAVEVFSTLDSSTTVLYVALIKVVIGMVPFLIIVSGIWDVVGPKSTYGAPPPLY